MSGLNHYINTAATEPALARSAALSPLNPVPFPVLFLSDNKTHNFFFHNQGVIESFSGANGYTLRVTVGDTEAGPFGGTYTLTCGANTTTALAYSATAAQVSAALNLLASIIAQGGVSVVGTFPNFLVYNSAIGAVTAISGTASLLQPDSTLVCTVLTTGDATHRQQTQICLRQNAVAQQSTWSQISGGWSGILSTATEGGAALIAQAGTNIGGYLQATTLVCAEVIDASNNVVAFYQTIAYLRAKPTDVVSTSSAAIAGAVLADPTTGALISPTNFFTGNNISLNPLTTLGDTIYGGAAGVETRLPGNTTSTRKLLRQLGTGVVSAAPAWDTLVAGDIPDLSGTYQLLNAKLTAIGTLANGAGWLHNDGAGVFVYSTPTKTDVGLGNVENTALSTWAGSANLTTLGTIGTGVWNATAIADGKIASALTGKTYNALTLTAAATGFTIAGGTTSKTLTVSNTLALAGTDSSTLNIGAGGTLGTGAFQPQTVLTGTAGQIAVSNGGVGATTLTIPTAMTGITSITAPASTDLTLNAGSGANNNITLVPFGTGQVIITSGSNTAVQANIAAATSITYRAHNTVGNADFGADGSGNVLLNAVTAGKSITFLLQGTEKARFATTTGNLLLGGLTTDGTGVLQFPAGTTSAGGITFGTDVNIYRTAAGTFNVNGNGTFGVSQAASTVTIDTVTGSTNANLVLNGRSSGTIKTCTIFADQNGQLRFQSASGQPLSFEPGSTAALVFDGNQRASFTPGVIASGVTSYFKVQAPADTGLSASTESVGVNFLPATRTWADGTVSTQREVLFQAPTYNKTTTLVTMTVAATVAISGAPIAGAGVTLNSTRAFWVQSGLAQFDGTTFAALTTDASSVGTGSFITLGGVGVAKQLWAGGAVTFGGIARAGGVLSYLTVNTPADTSITASTESIGENHVTATRTWATTGTVTLQRERFYAGPTYASASASQTFTDVFNVYMTPPIAGSNAIFTRGHTLGIVDSTSAASSITGGFIVAAALGTAGTSVGIGGGNINAGGTITAGSSYTSGAPNGGTAAAWKLGTVVTGVTSTFVSTNYVQIDIGGTLYKLATVTSIP